MTTKFCWNQCPPWLAMIWVYEIMFFKTSFLFGTVATWMFTLRNYSFWGSKLSEIWIASGLLPSCLIFDNNGSFWHVFSSVWSRFLPPFLLLWKSFEFQDLPWFSRLSPIVHVVIITYINNEAHWWSSLKNQDKTLKRLTKIFFPAKLVGAGKRKEKDNKITTTTLNFRIDTFTTFTSRNSW